VSYLVIF